jgi:superfamily II DNA or RNA helicase
MEKNYIGKKGYTIPKTSISDEEIARLKTMLTVRPSTSNPYSGFKGASQYHQLTQKLGPPLDYTNSYPVFRESKKKLYVPRFFGIKQFGECNLKDDKSMAIDVPFVGELRENQKPVVEAFRGTGLLELECAYGKTVIALNIISKFKTKTLVIVHKEFLMNQWIERIGQFLPTARIGKIQGTVVDIDDKDIVLGMLQTLSMKTFADTQFETFGLTVVDECHHISSEVFSCALFNIVTKYMLGLSATMERKDGTTYVIKMFLGEVCFTGKNNVQHNVNVNGISFIERNNNDFNSLITDYKGNVQYSKMISKLCSYEPRSLFIVAVLQHLLKSNDKQQIMVLAHNKSLLKYIHDLIVCSNAVGYYVGGMKHEELRKSETKQIILATYSMASEALDIKTLTTLVMATPKTDIEQCVGRILRQKNETSPLVIDIIDDHSPFRNQWRKRKTFYKSKGYDITEYTNESFF